MYSKNAAGAGGSGARGKRPARNHHPVEKADACLIDSGSDKDAARKALKILDENGWKLSAVYNTHSNADHIGGNAFLQERTGCAVYAPGIECDFTCHPILEPSFLYGGFPFRELRHKFLLAKESRVEELLPQSLPAGFELIPLPGHFFSMTGFRTLDDVVFLADCLASRETLEKYRITFIYDVGAYLETLEAVKEMKAKLFVPSHAAATEDIAPLAQRNIEAVRETAARIVGICAEPLHFEAVLQRLFCEYNLTMNFEQYVLAGSTVRSYLSYLKDAGEVEAFFEDNLLLWHRA